MAPFILNGRLAKLMAKGFEFRDSYIMIPVALKEYDKTEIDYDLFEEYPVCQLPRAYEWFEPSEVRSREPTTTRELFKADIRAYQKDDCVFLGQLCQAWHELNGDKLTMASVALSRLRSFHGFETLSERQDDEFRPFYFGGRCEAFEVGELRANDSWQIFDVNSMYPYVMASQKHPVSGVPSYTRRITPRTHFAYINATSHGALPRKADDGSLSFPHTRGDFHACIHEIRAAEEVGALTIHKVYWAAEFDVESDFSEFVLPFYQQRLEAKARGDKIATLFLKLVLNSSYGKFAQDPRKYENFLYDPESIPFPQMCGRSCEQTDAGGNPLPCESHCVKLAEDAEPQYAKDGWYLHTRRGDKCIYARPQKRRGNVGFFNVATAASITSAARAQLLRGLHAAKRPIYCDTDSIICEGLDQTLALKYGMVLDENELGAWKTEAEGDTACIAGKKLYAVFDKGESIKKASKGVRLTAEQITRVCRGEVVEYKNPVPKFKLSGDVDWITRNIRRTA
jgi:hypothetical protein